MLRPFYDVEELHATRPTAQTPEKTGSVPVKENIATSTSITAPLERVTLFMSEYLLSTIS
jgi:hypothetical protein